MELVDASLDRGISQVNQIMHVATLEEAAGVRSIIPPPGDLNSVPIWNLSTLPPPGEFNAPS